MRFIRLRPVTAALAAAALGASLLGGTALGLAGTATASTAAPAASPAATLPVLVNCQGHGQVRPRSHVLACADGADTWTKLAWTRWSAQALGTGTDVVNTCVPTCVGGKFKKYPVIVVLWRTAPLGSGGKYYSRATVIYTAKIPAGFTRSRTITLQR